MKDFEKALKYLGGIVVLVAFIGACAQLGLTPADTFEQKLAYAYGTHTAVLNTATDEVRAGMLKPDDATQVLQLADQARGLLDAARLIKDPAQANAKLILGLSLLQQLQTYLRSRQ